MLYPSAVHYDSVEVFASSFSTVTTTHLVTINLGPLNLYTQKQALMAGQKLLAHRMASPSDHTTTDASFITSTEAGLQAWIYWHYSQKGFQYDGTYKSLAGLKEHLFALNKEHPRKKIKDAIRP
jgi:negative regulator of sigma E activity